jgi:hypothetical protein
MKNYELPDSAKAMIRRVTELEATARRSQERVEQALARLEAAASELERDRASFEAMVSHPAEGFELVASAWADYERARAQQEAAQLLLKPHSARSAAEAIQAKGKELAEARRRATLFEYIVALYERHFPWLEELRDQELESAFISEAPQGEDEENRDPARHWLRREEWSRLSTADRNQLALDRYLRSKKSAWQLGRDYERYIGYLREREGCEVTYYGIQMRFADLGRDVLAEKDEVIEVIQCKRWAQHKTIHEPYVFQLYGTMVLAGLENPTKEVTGTFTTTTSLSDLARRVANHLGIKVEENFPLEDYPRIKCNVARGTAERIYHLPFDQQYDSVLIEPDRGEFYAATVAEAEEAGFRRAWRWRGEVDAGGAPKR